MRKGQKFKFLACFVLLTLIAGCTNVNNRYRNSSYFTQTQQQHGNSEVLAAEYMQRAQESTSPNKEQYLLKAAEQFLNARQTKQASQILTDLNSKQLPPALKDIRQLLLARIALNDADPKATLYALSKMTMTDVLSTEAKIDILESRAQAEEQLGYVVDSVKNRIALETLLQSYDDITVNRQKIWQSLISLPVERLKASINASPSTLNGWLELAAIAREHPNNLNLLNQSLAQWKSDYPDHPATGLLEQQSDLKVSSPISSKRIALLLPLSGSLKESSRSIRDGFLSAYYRNRSGRIVKVYNTQGDKRIEEAYQKALADGVDMIVGPLTKDGVAQMVGLTQGQIPVLTLNQLHDGYAQEGVFQIGLAPEDEALQVAKQAWSDGHMNAIILSPSSAWGDRQAMTFQNAWQDLGGAITDSYRYDKNSNLAQTIAKVLHIPDSQSRAKTIQSILGRKIKYNPRRREDVDMIFLVASPNVARQIRPLLAFYYAGGVPLYATSSVYSGVENPRVDGDMNGTVFCDAPWLIDENGSIGGQNYRSLWPSSGSSYKRFFALGMDAYGIINELTRMQDFPGLTYQGVTGDLVLLDSGRLQRRLPCAKFVHGIPKLIAKKVM